MKTILSTIDHKLQVKRKYDVSGKWEYCHGRGKTQTQFQRKLQKKLEKPSDFLFIHYSNDKIYKMSLHFRFL